MRAHAGILVAAIAASIGLSVPVLAQPALTKPEDVGLSSAKLSLIHDALKVQVDSGQIPGGIVLVARDGKVVYLEAQGITDPVSKRPMQTDLIYGTASLTKPVAAVAAMMLVDDGKLNLDDPVSKFIPEFGGQRLVRVLKPGSPPAPFTPMPGPVPVSKEWGEPQYEMVAAERPITVRMLLTHTSGIQIFGVDNPDFPRPEPGDNLATRIPKLATAALEYQPGSRWA
ncbi:MAG: hypothetical protein RLZZ403_1658, partial [Pseudomonadota bacterium]